MYECDYILWAETEFHDKVIYREMNENQVNMLIHILLLLMPRLTNPGLKTNERLRHLRKRLPKFIK